MLHESNFHAIWRVTRKKMIKNANLNYILSEARKVKHWLDQSSSAFKNFKMSNNC